jgi:hypothetical protein
LLETLTYFTTAKARSTKLSSSTETATKNIVLQNWEIPYLLHINVKHSFCVNLCLQMQFPDFIFVKMHSGATNATENQVIRKIRVCTLVFKRENTPIRIIWTYYPIGYPIRFCKLLKKLPPWMIRAGTSHASY